MKIWVLKKYFLNLSNNLKVKCYYTDYKLLEDRNYALPLFLSQISGNQWMLNNSNWRKEGAEKEEEVKENSLHYHQRPFPYIAMRRKQVKIHPQNLGAFFI